MTNPDAVSIDAIIKAMYESISGKAGEPRQWERDRALYHPKALLIPTRPLPEGGAAADVFDMDGYIESRTPFFAANDFFEIEIARREFRFGSIAHVLSFYEGRKSPAPDGELLKRGVNSIQLFHDGERWWVLSIAWDNEREGVKLPEPAG
ncbi:MAG: hypothetical protein WEB59_06640 [Thermoanaerobaculia bacterium]